MKEKNIITILLTVSLLFVFAQGAQTTEYKLNPKKINNFETKKIFDAFKKKFKIKDDIVLMSIEDYYDEDYYDHRGPSLTNIQKDGFPFCSFYYPKDVNLDNVIEWFITAKSKNKEKVYIIIANLENEIEILNYYEINYMHACITNEGINLERYKNRIFVEISYSLSSYDFDAVYWEDGMYKTELFTED